MAKFLSAMSSTFNFFSSFAAAHALAPQDYSGRKRGSIWQAIKSTTSENNRQRVLYTDTGLDKGAFEALWCTKGPCLLPEMFDKIAQIE